MASRALSLMGSPKPSPGATTIDTARTDGTALTSAYALEDLVTKEWFCHCCTAKNEYSYKPSKRERYEKDLKCRVCGRPENYAKRGYVLPLHGDGGRVFRPSQLATVLPNVHDADSAGWTPLHSSAVNGNTLLCAELLRLGADVDPLTDQNQTPLILSVYSGNLDTVKLLLKHGADAQAFTSFEKNQAIHIAADKGYRLILEHLISNAGASANAKNAVERTPLHLVALNGRVDMAAFLLRHGAKPEEMDAGGWTPRQMAELNSHRSISELLCQASITEKAVLVSPLVPCIIIII